MRTAATPTRDAASRRWRAVPEGRAVRPRALLLVALWLVPAAHADVALPSSMAWPAQAQAGDLVFRQGTEAVSAAVLSVDGGPYSHVGMLVGEPGRWQVIHATPAERADRADGVVIDSLDFYLDPARAVQYGLYQVEAEPAQRAAAVRAAYARLGDPFRIADPAGTYCTELVWAAWQSSGLDLAVTFTPLALPLLPGRYLLPSDLAASPRLHALITDAPVAAMPASAP